MHSVGYKNGNEVGFMFAWLSVTIFMFIIQQTWENTSPMTLPQHIGSFSMKHAFLSLQVILTAEDHIFTTTQENLRTGKMEDKIQLQKIIQRKPLYSQNPHTRFKVWRKAIHLK